MIGGDELKKFWNKADATNEIFIYGDITSSKWREEDVTAKSFADDLKSFGDKDVTIHLNSSGGDVFTGLAISNLIKSYKGKTTILIDGLAASAASLIACAGDTVKMASNAVYMVHQPSVGIFGFMEAADLEKCLASLKTVKESILTTYENRTKKPHAEIEKLVDAESYLSADEALENNFIDEITEEVDVQFDNSKKMIFMNKIELSCAKMDFEKIKTATHAVERKNSMEDVKKQIEDAVKADRQRIKNLNSLKCENAAINKILDLAIEDGKNIEEIKPYIDAVKSAGTPKVEPPKTPPENPQNNIFNQLAAIIKDNMQSGAENVPAAGTAQQTEDEKQKAQQAAQAELIAKYVNQNLKVGVTK